MKYKKYNPQKIERKWQRAWEREKIFRAVDFSKKKKFYALVEFPYPSGEGLHVGHAFTFTLMDIFARKKRMEGFNVLHPMGWDAFGLPTENYALRTGIHPKIVTKRNTRRFREQMKKLALSYNWDREINTTDPSYYKWTQWIFIQLFKHGLAYKKEMEINWCPSCKIGLANEEVVDGKCERCGARVGKKRLSQWLLKITKYADRLADELDLVDFPESVVASQRSWIGRSKGIEIKFPLATKEGSIPVFTTRPDTIFGTTFFVLAPEHPMVKILTKPKYKRRVENYIERSKKKMELERISQVKERTGVFTGSFVLNPINGKKIPVFVADFAVMTYGTGAVMGVPAHDLRDFDFARKYNLPIIEVIKPRKKILPKKAPLIITDKMEQGPYVGEGTLINSGRFTGMKSERARERIGEFLQRKGLARKSVEYHIRDWIFSRQHYWGEPIPMVFCENCAQKGISWFALPEAKKYKSINAKHKILNTNLAGWFPVPEGQLPVRLPKVKKYKPTRTGKSPLAAIKEWVQTKCPVCGGLAERETDTMPNWAGSSWYFLRYCDPKNDRKFASPKKLKYWMPVDVYLGGAEHTTLHLLYSRFWHKFLNDIKVAPGKEPYLKRIVHGLILGEDGRRMSKSRGNVIAPDEMIEKFGADSLRTYLAFIGPYNGVFPWSTAGIKGTRKFLERFWEFVLKGIEKRNKKSEGAVKILVNRLIKEVGEDIDNFKFNTAVAKLMKFLNEVEGKKISKEDLEKVLRVLAPFAPYLTEEIWQGEILKVPAYKFRASASIHNQPWPRYNKKLIKEKTMVLVIQINGKVRDKIEVEAGISEKEAKKIALSSEKVKKWIRGRETKKTIFVPGKLINFVI